MQEEFFPALSKIPGLTPSEDKPKKRELEPTTIATLQLAAQLTQRPPLQQLAFMGRCAEFSCMLTSRYLYLKHLQQFGLVTEKLPDNFQRYHQEISKIPGMFTEIETHPCNKHVYMGPAKRRALSDYQNYGTDIKNRAIIYFPSVFNNAVQQSTQALRQQMDKAIFNELVLYCRSNWKGYHKPGTHSLLLLWDSIQMNFVVCDTYYLGRNGKTWDEVFTGPNTPYLTSVETLG